MNTESFNKMTHGVLLLSAIMLCGCEGLTVDTSSLLVPRFSTLWGRFVTWQS